MKHPTQGNPYRSDDTMMEFFEWSSGYTAACSVCTDNMDFLISHDTEFKKYVEFMTTRAYWQGANSDTDKNPYCSAQKPYRIWVEAWTKGRKDHA